MAGRRTLMASLTVASLALATAAATQLVVPANAEVSGTLQQVGLAAGIDVGVALDSRRLGTDGIDEAIVDREFGMITPEFEMLFDVTESTRNQFQFARSDEIVAWAQARGKKIRSGDVLRGATFMNWLANMPTDTRQEALLNHIDVVLGRYKGEISAWDVVSEAFYESGEARNDILSRTGSDWIEKSFTRARAADPYGKLCYGDYGIENWASAKTQAVYNMVRDFKNRGVPIDCVGIEGHFLSGMPYNSSFLTVLSEFSKLGVDVQITQLDVTGNSLQSATYQQVALDCRKISRCSTINVWGVRDHESWRSGEQPLLFDQQGNPKPAYYAFRNGLAGIGPTTTSPTTTSPTTTSPTTTSPTTTSTKLPKTKSPKTKRTVTLCKTRKLSKVTCKVVTRN